jgi:short-subunit dehydrogenase
MLRLRNKMEMKNAHIVITGATGGIGFAFAEMCAREGAHLHLSATRFIDSEKEKLLQQGAASVSLYPADLSSYDGVRDLISRLESVPVDILFNNAGQLTGGLLETQDIKKIYSMLQVNVNALIQLTHGILPSMLQRKKGKIINNASVTGVMHFPCASTYSASKAAVIAFTDCLEVELAGTGVGTLLLITPGVKTRMFDEIEELYGQNISVEKMGAISPEKYAKRIHSAILSDAKILEPRGSTGMMLKVAKHSQSLFAKLVSTQFKR